MPVKTCVKIKRPEYGSGGIICPLDQLADMVLAEFDGADIGDQIVIELVDAMSQEQIDELPEFEGW